MNGLVVVLAALGGGLLSELVRLFFNRTKTSAEADEVAAKTVDIITKTAVDLLERTTKLSDAREKKLEGKIGELELRVDNLSTVIDALTGQLEHHGLIPVIPPMLTHRKIDND